MNGMNRVILIGHIGQDPEVRATTSGKRIAKVSIATSNGRKVDGNWVESTDWHRATAFDGTADFLARFARKGDLIAVDCALRPHKWDDSAGKTHHEVSIVIDRVAALHSRTRRDVGAGLGDPTEPRTQVLPIEVDASPDGHGEALPF